MTVSSAAVLNGYYNAARAIGQKSINSDATFEIVGQSDLTLLVKQFPWPVIGPAGEIESPGPMGSLAYQPQQLRTGQQGPITFTETVSGRIMRFMKDVAAAGAVFNANVYEGTPDRFVRGYKLIDCFFVPDQADRDWENRAQITLINGTLFFHWFGQELPGAAPSL